MEVVEELDLYLTGGRLNANATAVIIEVPSARLQRDEHVTAVSLLSDQ